MKIELVKTESDWIQASLGCYISVNSNLLDVVTPLNNPHEINSLEVPKEGILRLVIRDMGRTDGYLGSISVPISLLTTNTSLWLPLFNSPSNDTLSELQQRVELPRILLSVLDQSLNESLNQFENNTIDFENIDLQNSLVKTSDFNCLENNENKEFEEKKQEIIEILNLEIENFKEELEKEKEKNKNLVSKFNQTLETIKSNSERAVKRENSLLDLMNEKEEQLSKCIEINIELQNNIRKLELEKKLMSEKLEKFEVQESYVRYLETEAKKYQEMLRVAEKNREELTNTLVECSQLDIVDEPYNNKHREAKTPELKLKFDLNNENPQFSKQNQSKNNLNLRNSKGSANSSVDEKNNVNPNLDDNYIKKIIQKSIGKEINKIERIRECLYKVNNLEISLAICDDGLYVKHGNSLITLHEFWNKEKIIKERNSVTPVLMKKSPIWIEKDSENDYRKVPLKNSPSKGFLKSTESSQKKLKSLGETLSTKNLIGVLRSRIYK